MKVRVRRAKDREPEPVEISGEFIRLDALLKFAAVLQSGGEAKRVIQDGLVTVNGEVCLQRGKKVRPGDVVVLEGTALKVTAAGQAANG